MMFGDQADADRLLGAFHGCVGGAIPIAVGVLGGSSPVVALDGAKQGDRFEFGSITKTMTAQVLATLVTTGRVALGDEIGRWLDAGPNGSITLEQLARHCSGLPRMAANADDGEGFDELDPYAVYSAELAEVALRATVVDPDRSPLYSNFGYQLLGLALERAADATLEELFAEHVFGPFGLANAAFGSQRDLVQGHREGTPTSPWTILLTGPGGVIGTIEDLLVWGSAVADPPAGRLGDALRIATDARPDGIPVGLGWQLHDGLTWHNGGTYGFKACLAIDRDSKRVAATLIGTSDLDHVDDATFLAARGLDPLDARPEPAGPQRNGPALAIVDALVARDWGTAQAAMHDQCRAVLTTNRMQSAWENVMGARGPHISSTVRNAQRKRSITEVTVDIKFENGAGWAKVTFDQDALVVGLLIG